MNTNMNNSTEGHLERLRGTEVAMARKWLKPGLRVLDFGGGSGYQASIMASYGCQVLSIDVADRSLPDRLFHPVQIYDGQHIPAPDASFDVVFSSTVLEHIQPLPPILAEIRRVLKPDGLAVHVVPSPVWRWATSLAHYIYVGKLASRKVSQRWSQRDASDAGASGKGMDGCSAVSAELEQLEKTGEQATEHRSLSLLKWALFGSLTPHGEYSNAFVELYYFSKRRWLRLFESNGFHVVTIARNNLFYTGYGLFPDLPLQLRRRGARVLGSTCYIFVMRAKAAGSK